jgi:hypothetical protein
VSGELCWRVRDRGAFFATRHAGRQVYVEAAALLDSQPDGQLVLDFAGVEAVTLAFADELVANLVERFGARIVVADLNEDVFQAIWAALRRRAGGG